MIRGVILDVDGTLVDSNDAHARSWVAAFRDVGEDVPFERVRPMIGMGGDQLVPRVTGDEKGSERYEALSEAWKRHFTEEELPQIKAQPGTRDLLDALLARGLRVIIGTSADEALVEGLLDRAGLADLKLPYTTASDVEHSKPEPDIVAAAVEKLGLSPGDVLMVGDTPYDVQSAARAGVGAVFLRCGGDDREEGARFVFADPAEFAARLAEVVGESAPTGGD